MEKDILFADMLTEEEKELVRTLMFGERVAEGFDLLADSINDKSIEYYGDETISYASLLPYLYADRIDDLSVILSEEERHILDEGMIAYL